MENIDEQKQTFVKFIMLSQEMKWSFPMQKKYFIVFLMQSSTYMTFEIVIEHIDHI